MNENLEKSFESPFKNNFKVLFFTCPRLSGYIQIGVKSAGLCEKSMLQVNDLFIILPHSLDFYNFKLKKTLPIKQQSASNE